MTRCCYLTAVLILLVTLNGCRAIADSLLDSLMGGEDDHYTSSRGSPHEPGISDREKQRRFEEIHINKAVSRPDWNWAPSDRWTKTPER